MIVLVLLTVAIAAAAAAFSSSRVIKTLMVAALFSAASAAFFSVSELRGWPTDEDLPLDGTVKYVEIVSPSSASDGAIYLWVSYDYSGNLFLFGRPSESSPRSFRVAYTEGNAVKADAMKKAIESGMVVKLGVRPKNGQGDGDGSGTEDGASGYLEDTTSAFEILNPSVVMPK